MANLVITSTVTHIDVDFGDVAANYGYSKGKWRKEHIIKVLLDHNNGFVEVEAADGEKWIITYNGTNGLPVASVDGNVPASNTDLYNKIIAII